MKISINKKTNQETIKVSKGDLIMLVCEGNFFKNRELRSASLGVFEGVRKSSHQGGKWQGRYIQIKDLYKLLPAKSLGRLTLPILQYEKEREYHANHIRELYVGKNQIMKRLKENPFMSRFAVRDAGSTVAAGVCLEITKKK